jgi:protein SCO1/2
MNSKWKNSRVAGLALVLLTAFVPAAYGHVPIPPKKGEAGRIAANTKAPDFTLVSQDGKRFSADKTRGKVVLVTFIFTTCPDVCPFITAKFAQIQRAVAKDNRPDDVLLISITTDPEVDTPQVLKSYAQRYSADLKSWAFLTGNERELAAVWRSFGVTVKKRDRGLVQHTGLTTLIDRRGMRRFNYYGDLWQEKDVLKDISTLLAEK